jgi:hypothetical protein
MRYDKKKGANQIGNLILDHGSFESRGQMRSDWNMLYSVGKVFSRAIKYCPYIFKANLI